MARRLAVQVRTKSAKESDARWKEIMKRASPERKEKKNRRPRKESRRAIALRALGFKNYEQYLASAGWIERRDAAVARAKNKCQLCGDFRWTLNVHHNTYENLGDEWDSDLVALCGPCHIAYHDPRFQKMRLQAKKRLMHRIPSRKRQFHAPKTISDLRDEINDAPREVVDEA